jgi:hypothetical protein
MTCALTLSLAGVLLAPGNAPLPAKELLPGFHRSPWFDEQVREQWIEGDVRALVNAAGDFDRSRPTRLVIYATPNGSSIEHTLGCGPAEGLDYRYDLQHVAGQIRRLRELSPKENIVLACVQAEGLSWPAWRRRHDDSAARARRVVDWVEALLPSPAPATLTGHSGGGSFVFANIDAADAIPPDIERIAFLDSNYSYSETDKHGDKLLSWLKGDEKRRLYVIAYDDREIRLNGKKVVGDDGGTFRATNRMLDRFRKDVPIVESKTGDVVIYTGVNGRLSARVHLNPKNAILHSALVGDMNGLIVILADDRSTPPPANERLTGPRPYTKWVQPAPAIPPRPADAGGGAAFMRSIAALPRDGREEAIATEICRGNVPDFLRRFQRVTVTQKNAAGKEHTVTYEVMPDYLAVGSDADFVRVPMSPLTAQRIADAFGCALPTRKIANEVYQQSTLKLAPIPLTKDREAVETFVQHNRLIEEQRAGKELGQLVAGIKKDVVITNRLGEKANRVAIFGWHKPDGKPIQPLTIVHVNWYVDYSHGTRLMKRLVTVDGKPQDVRAILHSGDLCGLISDEGPIQFPSY